MQVNQQQQINMNEVLSEDGILVRVQLESMILVLENQEKEFANSLMEQAYRRKLLCEYHILKPTILHQDIEEARALHDKIYQFIHNKQQVPILNSNRMAQILENVQ